MAEKRKWIDIGDSEAENCYDAPLWLDDDYLLLPAEMPISESLLRNLRGWAYRKAWTDGARMDASSPAAAETLSGAVLNNDAEEAEGRRAARGFFEKLAVFTRNVYDSFGLDGSLDMNAITNYIKDTILMMKDYKSYMLRLPDLTAEAIDYLYTHSARTVIIALSIGEAMKLPNFRLIELGIAALLHEVGMLKIPRQIYEKTGGLTETERKLMATHPAQGVMMLQKSAKDNANPLAQDILMGVWHHHERFNGSGYPQGLSGDGISLFGKILGAACSYDAQISKRPHDEGKDGYTGMLMMLKEMRSLYDEKVISALLQCISIYPLGTYVHLENGSVGVVVSTGPDNPKFPVVKLHLDKNMHVYKDQPVIRTQEQDGLNISGVLSRREIDDLISNDLLPR